MAAPVETGAWATWRDLPRPQRSRVGGCASYLVLLTLLFLQPLARLMLYAARSDLHSHILLVPLIAGTVTGGGIGVAALAAGIEWRGSLSINDGLALMALALVSFVAAGGSLFL